MHICRWVCHWQAAFCLVSRYTHPTLAYTRCTVSMLSVWTWWLRARRGRWMWLPPLMVAEPSCQSPLWKLWWRACDIVLCMPSESAPAPQPWSLCQLVPVLASVTTVSSWCDAQKPLAPGPAVVELSRVFAGRSEFLFNGNTSGKSNNVQCIIMTHLSISAHITCSDG